MALTVHVWSDVACPWCFVGKRRLEAAVERLGAAVDVEWHSFELDPSRGSKSDLGYAERLAKKYGFPLSRAEGMLEQMTQTGQKDGIVFDFGKAVPASTFDAHRLIQLAGDRSLQNQLEERLFAAHFTEGVDLGDHAQLTRVAVEAGLDADEVAAVLASDQYADEVAADKAAARELGVSGVPFFVIGRYGVSGAQPTEHLLQVLDRANAEDEPEPEASLAEGAQCGPAGC